MTTTKYTVHFSGNAIETTVTEEASAVDEWINSVRSSYGRLQDIMVGLDCEWKPHVIRELGNKTATMQLCVDKCLIVQMFYLDYIPQSMKSFLIDPNVKFVGVEVGDDADKLRAEYGLRVVATADIQAMAMEHWPVEFYRKPGLKDLAWKLVGLRMAKPLHVCRSNWEARVLSEEQVEYAAIDAYASYRIGRKLIEGT